PDEAHRGGADDLALAGEAQAAAGGIQGREELVLGEHLGAGDGVEQGGLAGVGVAHDGDHRQRAAVALLAARGAILREPLDAALEEGDALTHPTTVDLELGLTGTASAQTAGEAREAVVALNEAGHAVAELGELDLQLAVRALRPLGEDVQDELGAV